jgi:hypothetical protein
VLVERALPGAIFLLGQLIALQRLFEGDAAGAQRTYSAGTRPKTFRQFWNRVLYDSLRWRGQSRANLSLVVKSLLAGKIQGILFVLAAGRALSR